PDDRVLRRVEYAVKRKRELHDPEVRREVTAGFGDVLDEKRSNLSRKLSELLLVQSLQIRRRVDVGQQGHVSLTRRYRRRFQPFGNELEHVCDAHLLPARAGVRGDM